MKILTLDALVDRRRNAEYHKERGDLFLSALQRILVFSNFRFLRQVLKVEDEARGMARYRFF